MKQDFAMSDFRIRLERKEDYPVVENMIREAFWNVNVPGASEHYLAHLLRDDPDFIPELDFVAEIDGKIVGSILYVRARLVAEDGTVKDCISFGPLSVRPDYQRRGIGKALISHSLEKAKEMGANVVVILGHPSNYVARGFQSCIRKNIGFGDGYFCSGMLVKQLVPNTLDDRRYRFEESPVFDLNEAEIEEFDRRFPKKEKKVLPQQKEFFINSHSVVHL